MAIKNRQHEADIRQHANVLAWVVKGITKNGRPVDTDSFHFNVTDSFEHVGKHIAAYFGPSPQTLPNVHVLTDDPADDISYEVWYEKYAQTKDGRRPLVRRCNGEQIVGQRGDGFAWVTDKVPCECGGEPDPANRQQCTISGKLRFWSPGFIEYLTNQTNILLPDTYFVLGHGSVMDDESLHSSLLYVYEQWAKPYGIPLSSVPLMLYRSPVRTQYGERHILRLSVMPQHMLEMRQQGRSTVVLAEPADMPLGADAAVDAGIAHLPAEIIADEPQPGKPDNSPQDTTNIESRDVIIEWLDTHLQRHTGTDTEGLLRALNERDETIPLLESWQPRNRQSASLQVLDWLADTGAQLRIFGILHTDQQHYSTKFCHLELRLYGAGTKFEQSDYPQIVADVIRKKKLVAFADEFDWSPEFMPLVQVKRNTNQQTGEIYYTVDTLKASDDYIEFIGQQFDPNEGEFVPDMPLDDETDGIPF